MKGNSLFKIHNYFDLILTNTRTGEEKHYHAENIVLDRYYSTRLVGSSNTIGTIQLGTGVGTLSTNRTSLFSHLISHTYTTTGSNTVFYTEVAQLSERRYKITMQTTFIETEANGDLTEIGLGTGTGNNQLVTHALFTDSENNPITITKTNVDRLTITATLFAEYSITGVLKPFGSGYRPDGVSNPALVCNTEIDLKNSAPWSITGELSTGNDVTKRCDNLARLPRLLLGRSSALITTASQGTTNNDLSISYYLVTIPSSPSHSSELVSNSRREEPRFLYLTGNAKAYYTLASGLIRSELSGQYNSGSGNIVYDGVTYTYQIKAIGWHNLVYIQLPNHDIFPPKLLTFELTADGTSTGYNLGVPELMTSGVEVSIDGVVQDSSTYTFYGKDFNLIQAWASADTKYIKEIQAFYTAATGGRRYDVPFPHWVSSDSDLGGYLIDDGNGGQPAIIYDFESPKTVDTLASMSTAILSYSSDCTNWTQAASITKVPSASNHSVVYKHFTPVAARYWKVTFATDRGMTLVNWDRPLIALHSEFDEMKPQIEFNNPPAAGAVITVKAYTEYPIKNENWIINGTVIDAIMQRGSGQ